MSSHCWVGGGHMLSKWLGPPSGGVSWSLRVIKVSRMVLCFHSVQWNIKQLPDLKYAEQLVLHSQIYFTAESLCWPLVVTIQPQITENSDSRCEEKRLKKYNFLEGKVSDHRLNFDCNNDRKSYTVKKKIISEDLPFLAAGFCLAPIWV